MINIFNDKKGRVQKLILIILVTLAIFLIPIGIYASENTTNVDDNSVSEQPLDETVDDIVVVEPIIEEEFFNETIVEEQIVNESSNETEMPSEDDGAESDSTETPALEVEILYPKEITRGESINLIAVITNTGNLEINHALVNYTVPSGFEISSVNQEEFDILLPGDSFEVEINQLLFLIPIPISLE